MDELLEQFLIEGPELVEQAGADLLALEQRPGDDAHLDGAFRAIHTLKGSVGLFDLEPMGVLLHRAEDLLDEVRQGRAAVTTALIDRLLSVVDQCGVWLKALARDGRLDASAADESRRLVRMLDQASDDGPSAAPASAPPAAAWARDLQDRHPEAFAARTAVRYRPDPQAYFRGDDPLALARAVPGLIALEAGLAGTAALDDYDPFVCALTFELLSSAAVADLAATFRFVKDQVEMEPVGPDGRADPVPASSASPLSTMTALRIDGRRIDALADLADQLVVAKNALLALPDPEGTRTTAEAAIDRLATALHGDIMRLRLVPVSPVLRRLERQARDLASELGKTVDMVFRGHAVEADKSIVDALYEPLIHLVRNALDHGIETGAERLDQGKRERARVTVAVRVVGDEIEIEINDDGRGMDPTRLRATAEARGLASAAVLDALSDQAALDLIFAPGFSTAAAVTAVSGRGVGMDAVRTAITGLGGQVSVASTSGEGATLTLRLPLTIVMTRVLLVESAGERFGVPLGVVRETLRIEPADLLPVRLGRAVVVRDAVLPYLDLAGVTGAGSGQTTPGLAVLVVETAAGRVALGVDRVLDRMDVVLKPIAGLLARVPGALGTTLLGDGRLLMVLDIEALAR
jgi:two-component system chemotaxis sensor kinase CheA